MNFKKSLTLALVLFGLTPSFIFNQAHACPGKGSKQKKTNKIKSTKANSSAKDQTASDPK